MLNNTLQDVLLLNKQNTDKGITFIYIDKKEYITYKDLYEESMRRLSSLRENNLKAGDEILLLLFDIKEFIISFWSCILGGIIPFIIPFDLKSIPNTLNMIKNILSISDEAYIITNTKLLDIVRQYKENMNFETKYNKILNIDEMKNTRLIDIDEIKITTPHLDDIAMIQYSSGSIGEPKGVMLTHKNMMANIMDIKERLEYTEKDSSINWLPLTHDLGLIAYHLTPIYLNINQYQMPTQLFMENPILWMDIISNKKITSTGSPNFGLKHFLNSIDLDKDYNWDLSSFRVFINGAESISCELSETFLKYLKKYKIKDHVMYTAYGMAEATLAVTVPKRENNDLLIKLQRNKMKIGNKIVLSNDESQDTIILANVGEPMTSCEIRICDLQDKVLDKETIGAIQIKGMNVTKGYYKNSKANNESFTSDGWFRTGDIGFIKDNSLIVTGRLKDMIIINGQNIFPADIENIIQKEKLCNNGEIAACGIKLKGNETQSLIIFVSKEIYNEEFSRKIKLLVSKEIHVHVENIVSVYKIPKTVSGKVQRLKLKEQYEEGDKNIINNPEEDSSSCESFKCNELPDIENMVESYCKEIFQFDYIDKDDNLIELGADSQGIFKLYECISKIDKDTIVSDIFSNPTIAAISNNIYSHIHGKDNSTEIKYSIFPDKFFYSRDIKNDIKSYRSISFNIENYRFSTLASKCSKCGISSSDVILAAFIISLSNEINSTNIVINSILNDYDMVQKQYIDMDKYNSLIDLIKSLDKTSGTIDLKDIYGFNKNCSYNMVIPLIYNSNMVSQDIDLSRYYDLIFSIDSKEKGIMLKIKYDKKRYISGNIEEFVRSFNGTLNIVINKI